VAASSQLLSLTVASDGVRVFPEIQSYHAQFCARAALDKLPLRVD